MNRFRFDLATEADDADLRAVLRATPMEGRIAVCFQREPSWFAAAVLDGDQRQIVACRDLEAGRLVGFGCRSLRRLYVDGVPQCIGYLSSLRLIPALRSRGLVARGYRYFRELHEDGRAPYYLTTIAEGNVPALRTLVGGRAGLPHYLPAGRYFTLAIPIRRMRLPTLPPQVAVRRAGAEDLPRIVAFAHAAGPERQFFPWVAESDFGRQGERLRGLLASDFISQSGRERSWEFLVRGISTR